MAQAQDISAKRKRIEEMVAKTMVLLDPPVNGSKVSDNEKYWKDFFAKLDDRGFEQFMNLLKTKRTAMHITMPNMKKPLRIPNLVAAANEVGLTLTHRLWLPDRTRPGKKYLTNQKYLVLTIPIRRAQQEWDKKLSVPEREHRIDSLTGQVAGDDRACAISAPEIQSLNVRGLQKTLLEIVKVRGGDVNAFGDFNRQLQESGSARLAQIDPRSRARAATISHVLLESMMIANNL